tara:strand:+ start:92703 stop:94478 length:1776 start_codon:yes stop_codon:yes gene_type:complete
MENWSNEEGLKFSALYWHALKNSRKGEPGVVVGNGPSLKVEDLHRLQNFVSIASNKIYLAFPKTSWRPTFFSMADYAVMEKMKPELFDYVDIAHAPVSADNIFHSSAIRFWKDLGPVGETPEKSPTFSSDLEKGAYAGWTITYFNLQLAIHLGLNPIYIIGCDHYYQGESKIEVDKKVKVEGQQNHFIEGYRVEGELVNPAPIDKMTLAYTHAVEYAKQNGIEVYNATRGGHLEVFPRVKFEDVFETPKEQSPSSEGMGMVSVAIPSFNSIDFIEECLNSVEKQTYQNIEVIIRDGFSTDGTWEAIQSFKERVPFRVDAKQVPPKGIYDGLNKCIEACSGEYVYILMSDDMAHPECFEKAVKRLHKNPACDICHFKLRVVDEYGEPVDESWEKRIFPRYLGELIDKPHIRHAPFDAICSRNVGTVYTGIVQYLTRRSLFDKVGLFKEDFGPYGDLDWQMRATTLASTVYLPEYLADWRRHSKQASQVGRHKKARRDGVFEDMTNSNRSEFQKHYPEIYETLDRYGLFDYYGYDRLVQNLGALPFGSKIVSALNRWSKGKYPVAYRSMENTNILQSIEKDINLRGLITELEQ